MAPDDAPTTPNARRVPITRPGMGFRHSQNRTTQPTYNLMTGRSASNSPAPSGQVSVDSHKENLAPHGADAYEAQRRRIEELRAEVGTLTYRSETARQEKEMAEARQAAELQDQRRRADEEYERAKAAEGEKAQAERVAEAAREEVAQIRMRMDEVVGGLERRVREAEEEARVLKEQLDELASVRDEVERLAERERMDAGMKIEAAQLAVRELESEREGREGLVGRLEEEARMREERVGALEAENIRLKAQSADVDTVAVVQRQLTEQVAHVRALEQKERENAVELKILRQKARLTDVAEEEKRALQRQLAGMERMQAELTETRIQKQRLEDERLSWAAYLEEIQEEGLQGPVDVVRKLVEERLGRAHEVERVGGLRAEIAALESRVGGAERERDALKEELVKKGSGNGGGESKSVTRLERQRTLAIKEVEYLRLQLNSFDIEDAATTETHDEARTRRIAELEGIVDEYKSEVQRLHSDLVAVEKKSTGNKRPRTDDEEDDVVAKRHRMDDAQDTSITKIRALKDELDSVKSELELSHRDLASANTQLASLKEASKTRILALKQNPTSAHEAVKQSTLNTLQRENADLLALVKKQSPSSMVPTSVLDATLLELTSARAQTASVEKTTRRLKEVWSAKSMEFREAIASTLGWSVCFMPNGKMRVESMYFPSLQDNENSIVFDGERGTMKVGGGPKSKFAARIAEQIGFWVRERGCVPGLLAALTIEFYEEQMNQGKDT